MTFIEIKSNVRTVPDILITFNNLRKMSIRFKQQVLDLLNIKVGERISATYEKENPKVLFLTKNENGFKIGLHRRILINAPFFCIEEKNKGIGIPYNIKDGVLSLDFNSIDKQLILK